MSIERPTKNPHLIAWVEEVAKLCKPDNVFWCDGSESERKSLTERAVAEKSEAYRGLSFHLHGERKPRRHRQVSADHGGSRHYAALRP